MFPGKRLPLATAIAALLLIIVPAQSAVCPDFGVNRIDVGFGFGPQAVAVRDFNGDGKADMAVANAFSFGNSVSIYLGNGSGGFTPAPGSPIAVGSQPFGIVAVDFNGDGKWDLATANCASNNISVLLGNGDGTFVNAPGSPFAVGTQPNALVAGDFNGDGRPDLAVSNSGDNDVDIYLGNGNGTFTASPGNPIAVGTDPISIVAGNFDAGTTLDLAVANSGSGNVSILLGNGNGTFTSSLIAAGTSPSSVTAADFNGDGKKDLAVANKDDNTLSILLGAGNGTFTAGTLVSLAAVGSVSPWFVLADDLDSDGRADLVVTFTATVLQYAYRVAILRGNGDGTFGSASLYATDFEPTSVGVGDFNSDGRKDLVTTNWTEDTLWLLFGKGNGAFVGTRAFRAFGDDSKAVTIADFNGDGKKDLAVANGFSNNISILLGDGSGAFGAAVNYAAGNSPGAIAADDFNGDGRLDLAVANASGNNVSILLGSGSGTFGAATNFAAGSSPSAVATGDFNGDGKKDLAVANSGSNNVSILPGNGDGTFAAGTALAAGTSPSAVVVADFNGDGKLDVAATNSGSNNVSIFPGNGNGTFAAPTTIVVGTAPSSLVAADFNSDGKQDLAVANATSNTVTILLGDGAGAFPSSSSVAVDNTPRSIAAADFDGNGMVDLITANNNGSSNTVSTLIGHGDGTFTRTDVRPARAFNSTSYRSVSTADLNGDGRSDFALANDVFDADVLVLISQCTFPATHLSVSAPSSSGAGSSFAFSVTALDQFGHPATAYGGTVHFTSSDGAATLPADSTLTDGTGTFNATLRTVGSRAITGTDTVSASITGTSNAIAVNAGAATHFAVSAPANVAAGSAFTVTVTALDAFNNTASGYSGTVHFTSSDSAATLPADATLTSGVGSFSTTLRAAGIRTITATDTVSASITGTSNAITVNAGAATHFAVSAPANATAGTAFTVNVTALDAFNNTATGYSGMVHFTSSDGSATLPADSVLTAGVGSFSATLRTAGSRTIAATDTVTSAINGISNSIAVIAGAATRFAVSAPAGAAPGTSISITVTALDASNNTATGYSGTVHFTSSDGGATLPSNSTLTAGSGTFTATLTTAGNQTITATDTVVISITGTSNVILVGAGAATHFVIVAPANATAGAAFSITVTAFDQFNNVATTYAGTLHFTSSDAQAALPANSTLSSGTGSFAVTLRTAAAQTITATDTLSAPLTGTSGPIVLTAGAATHFSIAAPSFIITGVAFNITVTALDAFNNTAAAYAGTVHFTSSDGGAALPVNSTLPAGSGTFAATLYTSGSQSITATDTVTASVTGMSAAIAVSAAPPTITGIAPNKGLAGGGQSVTISGTNLSGTSAVTFDGSAATITSVTPTAVVVTTPAHVVGIVDVTITTPGGTATSAGGYTYLATIPTLSEWMLMALAAALAAIALLKLQPPS